MLRLRKDCYIGWKVPMLLTELCNDWLWYPDDSKYSRDRCHAVAAVILPSFRC